MNLDPALAADDPPSVDHRLQQLPMQSESTHHQQRQPPQPGSAEHPPNNASEHPQDPSVQRPSMPSDDLAAKQQSEPMDLDNSSQQQHPHPDEESNHASSSASTRNQPARGAKSNTNGAGPIRRTRTARAQKQTSARKRYRNFGVQTGLDNFEEDPHPVARFVTPMQHPPPHPPPHPHPHSHPHPPPPPMPLSIREYPHSMMEGPPPPLPEGMPELMQAYPDPATVPPDSCRKLREHGINPHWLIKPPLGAPCHWRSQSCTTMRIDWRPGDWERHLQTHLPDDLKPYWDCPGCLKTFNRKDSFKRHLKRPETACSARVDVVNSSEWETVYYHEPLALHRH